MCRAALFSHATITVAIQKPVPHSRRGLLALWLRQAAIPNIKRGTVFADELANTAQLLIPHPLAGRPWRVVGPADVPGFSHLESSL